MNDIIIKMMQSCDYRQHNDYKQHDNYKQYETEYIDMIDKQQNTRSRIQEAKYKKQNTRSIRSKI